MLKSSLALALVGLAACAADERGAYDGEAVSTTAGAEAGSDGTTDDGGSGTVFDVPPGGDGADDGGSASECETLTAVVRDFRGTHPDFQVFWGYEANLGLVEPTLGVDGKPVFTGLATSPPQMSSSEGFDQWYRDVDGVNEAFEVDLELVEGDDGVYTYDDQSFFPVDGLGFGDEGNVDQYQELHNFHFTTEIRTEFEYEPGQTFTFTGDDDVWVFVDDQLVLDLGGLHLPLSATIVLDDLGLVVGEVYRLAIFHAERSTQESHFRVDTNIDCFEPVG